MNLAEVHAYKRCAYYSIVELQVATENIPHQLKALFLLLVEEGQI